MFLFILVPSILVLFIIFVFVSLDKNAKKLNVANNNVDKVVMNNPAQEVFDRINKPEVKVDNMFCKKDSDCLKKIFLNCNKGNGLFLSDELNYAFIINNKTENKCNVSFMGIDDKNAKFSAYCAIDLKDVNISYFEKLIVIKNLASDKNCSISK